MYTELKKTQALSNLIRIFILTVMLLVGITFTGLFVILEMVNPEQLKIYQMLWSICIVLLVTGSYFLVLKPSYNQFKSKYLALIESEESAKQMTQELNKLYNELGKSYQDLEAVNIIHEDPITLFKFNVDGEITEVSDHFRHIMAMEEEDEFASNIFDWMTDENLSTDFIEKLKTILSKGEAWNGELNVTDLEGDLKWLDLSLQPIAGGNSNDTKVLVIGRDVTEIKEAKQRSREITRETIEEKVKEQQYRSVLILEGQEEERKRIAQEIHDGIGQLLTGLKLNLEGITPEDSPKMKKRLKDTIDLMKSVIKEVRRVSFNLTPSSLVDFGIAPALKKISQEVTSLSNTTVSFDNRTNFINRLEKNVETNLYRIVQEAVNNGIKYAEASEIHIGMEHNASHLTVYVEDNGKGFEIEKLEKAGHFGASGHGIFNMKERAAFINAVLDIETTIGKGTKISIRLPLS